MTTMQQTRKCIDDMVAALLNDRKPSVNLINVERMLNEGFMRVTASVTHVGNSRTDKSVVMRALTEAVNNKLRPVDSSFTVVSSSSVSDTIIGIMTTNPETIAYTAGMEGFKVMAGNMFMDEEENFWQLQKTEAGNLLVKSRVSADDDIMNELMSACASGDRYNQEALNAVRRSDAVRNSLTGGDFITFVDPTSETVRFGAVIAGVYDAEENATNAIVVVAFSEGAEHVIIDRGMALAQVDGVDEGESEDVDQTATANVHSVEEIAAYYQRVFQRNPAYFAAFMERWNSHVFA